MIDFSKYETDAHSYDGSDAKRSIYIYGKYYMVKLPNDDYSSPNPQQTSVSSNVISEYVGSHIMQEVIGLETQITLLGYWGDQIAVACEDFREEGYELHEFSWYLQNVIPKNQIGRIPTYEQLYRVFNECKFLQGIREASIERYWDMIVGDALLGNFDRHKDNFGFLTNKDKKNIIPAPIYDCGGCLYPSLSEDKFEEILSSAVEIEKRIYEFPKIALNRNSNKNNEDKFGYFELLSSNFDKELTKAFFGIYPRINMKKVFSIIDNTPFISDKRKHFYKQILTYRKEMILDKSYEILTELPEVKGNRDFYFARCPQGTKSETSNLQQGQAQNDFDYSFGVLEEDEDFLFSEAVRLEQEKSKMMGKPICEYDREKQAPYLLYPDGSRKYPTLKDQSKDKK